MQKGFCPKQGKSLKNYAIFRFSCKPRGTISSARKHVFEKSVALPVFECYNSEAFAWTWEVAGTLIGVVTIAPAKREDRGIHTERICRNGG